MKHTIYLAARYSRFPEMQGYAQILATHGFEVTARWIKGDHDLRAHGQAEADHWMSLWAQEDIEDLVRADICISFTERTGDIHGRARGGRHAEFGMALILGKSCYLVGPREHVFHWMPMVKIYETWDACLGALVKGITL